MAKIRIVYGSETGNTESIAQMLESELKGKGHDVDCASAADVPAKDLGNGYDCVLMGTSLWGVDEVELQGDFQEYENSFGDMGLSGKKCAAFTSGSADYPLCCHGVNFIEEKYNEVGATIITEGLRIEGDANDGKDDLLAFAESVHKAL